MQRFILIYTHLRTRRGKWNSKSITEIGKIFFEDVSFLNAKQKRLFIVRGFRFFSGYSQAIARKLTEFKQNTAILIFKLFRRVYLIGIN